MASKSVVFGLGWPEIAVIGGALYLFRGPLGQILGGVGNAAQGVGTGIGGIGEGVATAAQGIGEGLGVGTAGLGTGVASAATGLGSGVGTVGSEVGQTFQALTDQIQALLNRGTGEQQQQQIGRTASGYDLLTGAAQGQTAFGLEQIRGQGALLRESDIQASSLNITGTAYNLTGIPLDVSGHLRKDINSAFNIAENTARGTIQTFQKIPQSMELVARAGQKVAPLAALGVFNPLLAANIVVGAAAANATTFQKAAQAAASLKTNSAANSLPIPVNAGASRSLPATTQNAQIVQNALKRFGTQQQSVLPVISYGPLWNAALRRS